MVKKVITCSILLTSLFGSIAFAQSTSTPTSTSRSASSTNPGSEVRQQNSVCVQAAVDKRNTAISAAQDIFKKALADARSARNSVLQSLKQSTSTNQTANRTARKAAQKTYGDAVKTAQKAFRDAKKAAEDRYKIDRKACRTSQSNRHK